MSAQSSIGYPKIIWILVSCTAGQEPLVRELKTRNVGPGSDPDTWVLEVQKGKRWQTLNLRQNQVGKVGVGPRPTGGTRSVYEGGIWCFEEDREEALRRLLEELAACMQKDVDRAHQSMEHIRQMLEPIAPKP